MSIESFPVKSSDGDVCRKIKVQSQDTGYFRYHYLDKNDVVFVKYSPILIKATSCDVKYQVRSDGGVLVNDKLVGMRFGEGDELNFGKGGFGFNGRKLSTFVFDKRKGISSDVVKVISDLGDNDVNVVFSSSNIQGDLPVLCELSNRIVSLYLEGFEVDVDDISCLSRLNVLVIKMGAIDNVSSLEDFQQLEMLVLDGLDDIQGDFSTVEKLSRLRRVYVSGVGVQRSDVLPFIKIEELRELSLAGLFIDDEALLGLGKMTDMQYLTLSFTGISTKTMESISRMNNLEELNVNGSKFVCDNDFSLLAKNKRIRVLQIGGTSVTDKVFAYLSQLEDLEYLVLADTSITEDGLVRLSGMRRLRSVMVDLRIRDRFRYHHPGNLEGVVLE